MQRIQISPIVVSGPIQPFGMDLAYRLDKGLGMLRSLSSFSGMQMPSREQLAAHRTDALMVRKKRLVKRNDKWQLMPMPMPDDKEHDGASDTAADESYTIAVVRINGPLTFKEDLCSYLMGGTSYEGLNAQIDEIIEGVKAGTIHGVLGDTHSPGGMVYGGFDCADRLYGLRDLLPCHAIVRDECCSAATLLTTAFEHVSITQTAEMGHVGVYRLHESDQGALDKAGILITAIYAGQYKMLGNWWSNLSKADKALLQKDVDYSYNLFARAVARYRNMPVHAVIDTQALVYRGADVVDVGFADAYNRTIEQALEDLASAIQERRRGGGPRTPNVNRRGGYSQSRGRIKTVHKPGMMAAVALALAATPFGQGAEVQQLALDRNGKDVAVYDQGDKMFMIQYSASEVATPENLARPADEREFIATLMGEPKQVKAFVPIAVDDDLGAGASAVALKEAHTKLEAAENHLAAIRPKFAEALGQLGVYRGKIAPFARAGMVQEAVASEAGLLKLQERIAHGASLVPQSANAQPAPNVGGSPAAGASVHGDKVVGSAGEISFKQWESMAWAQRAEVRQKDPEQYELLMAPERVKMGGSAVPSES